MSNKAIEAVLERVNALLSRTPDAGLEMAKIILLEENEKYFNKPTHRESHQDAFQCGYCTSGQIMSAVACVREGKATSRASIQAYMDTNICRCGAYQNIVDAIVEVAKSGAKI
jgi:xanthine dehydrogenase YagT iron-sulfur-binding subunit